MDASWRTVLVDGARVRLLGAGAADAPPLLFLHGWGLSPATYADGVTRLTAAGVRVLAPALPGFGGSDGLPLRSLDLPAFAARVARLLEVLDVGEPVFVLGHSFGGGVALQLAADRPDLVRSLTLVNPVGGATATGPAAWLPSASWSGAAALVAELRSRDVLRSAPGVLRDFVPLLRRPVTLALTAHLALTASLERQARAVLASGVPLLFVWSDDDRLVARGTLGEVVGELPAEVVPGRHGWLLSEPERFASLLHNALVVHAMLERRRPRGVTARRPA